MMEWACGSIPAGRLQGATVERSILRVWVGFRQFLVFFCVKCGLGCATASLRMTVLGVVRVGWGWWWVRVGGDSGVRGWGCLGGSLLGWGFWGWRRGGSLRWGLGLRVVGGGRLGMR